MSIYSRYNYLRSMGLDINNIVNSQEAKDNAKKLWKYRIQFEAFQEEKHEQQYVKYQTWLERNLGESLRIFLKYGDRFKIIQNVRKLINVIRRYYFELILVNFLLWIIIKSISISHK